jgi:hypothetical protein
MAQLNRTDSVIENRNTNENNNLWTTIKSKKTNRSQEQVIDVESTVDTSTNRFSRGLSKLSEAQQNRFGRSSDGSFSGRDMSVLHRLNTEHDEIRRSRAEYRELMERHMYKRPVSEPISQPVLQQEPIDILDKSMFPSLINSNNVETTIDVKSVVADGSLSQLMDEFKDTEINKPIVSGAWGKGNIKSVIQTNADKPVKALNTIKKTVQKNNETDSVTLLLDVSSLYADLLNNCNLDIVDVECEKEAIEIEDPDGFTKVVKTNRKKKSYY